MGALPLQLRSSLLPHIEAAQVRQIGSSDARVVTVAGPSSVNLEDIAHLAGVSRSTVSRVINNDPRVSAAVRERVQGIIDDVNFSPNAAARSLASRRTRIVGLLIPQAVETIFVDAWFAHLIQGCLSACSAQDLSLMLMMEPTDDAGAADRVIRRAVRGAHLDGLIISSSFIGDVLHERLMREQFPHVIVGRHSAPTASFVDVDNRSAAAAVTRHLLSFGRRRPIMIAGPNSMFASMDRIRGFRDAVAEFGFDGESVPVISCDWSQQQAFRATLEIFGRSPQPDAIFAASDSMAVGVLQALRQHGCHVPDDVGVVGFDDLAMERTVPLGLTTISQPIPDVTATAVAMLQQLRETRPPERRPLTSWLPTKLIVRTSCGATEPLVSTLPPTFRTSTFPANTTSTERVLT